MVVSVAPELAGTLKDDIENIALSVGFGGGIDVRPETNLPAGDCQIAWTGGMAEHRQETVWKEMETLIRNYFPDAGELEQNQTKEGKS